MAVHSYMLTSNLCGNRNQLSVFIELVALLQHGSHNHGGIMFLINKLHSWRTFPLKFVLVLWVWPWYYRLFLTYVFAIEWSYCSCSIPSFTVLANLSHSLFAGYACNTNMIIGCTVRWALCTKLSSAHRCMHISVGGCCHGDVFVKWCVCSFGFYY